MVALYLPGSTISNIILFGKLLHFKLQNLEPETIYILALLIWWHLKKVWIRNRKYFRILFRLFLHLAGNLKGKAEPNISWHTVLLLLYIIYLINISWDKLWLPYTQISITQQNNPFGAQPKSKSRLVTPRFLIRKSIIHIIWVCCQYHLQKSELMQLAEYKIFKIFRFFAYPAQSHLFEISKIYFSPTLLWKWLQRIFKKKGFF